MEHPHPRIIRHQRHARALVLAQQVSVGEVRDHLVAVRGDHLETHAVQVNRVLVLGHVLQFENVALALLKLGNRAVGTGLVGDVPGLAVDLPQARRFAVIDRHRTDPFEIEVEFLGIRQVRLGDRVGGQRRWPFGGRIGIGDGAEGAQAHRAVADGELFTGRRCLDRQTNTHARAQPVFLAQWARLDGVAVQRVDLRVDVGNVDAIGQRVVEIEQAHAGDLPGRQIDHRLGHAVDRRQAPGGAATRGFTGYAERHEGALFVHVPAFQAQGALVFETGRLALFDDQRAHQATAEFFAAVHVWVIPVAAGVRHAEFVIEVFAGQHRQLRDVRDAVHFQRQADAVPVNGGGDRQVVDKAHPQPLTLAHTQLGARRRGAKCPGFGFVAWHQFHVQRRGDQFVIVPGFSLGNFPQPVAIAATGTDAHYGQARETTQDLSTGKGSGHNNLTYLPQARGPQRADTIHLTRLNSKASHCRMAEFKGFGWVTTTLYTPKITVGGVLAPIVVGQLQRG